MVAIALAPDGPDARPDALSLVARDLRRARGVSAAGLAPVLDVAPDASRGLWVIHDVPPGARGWAEATASPRPASWVLARGTVLAEALGAAHGARLVHGRLDPEAVLVGDAPEETASLLGVASGHRPDDRPAAEDADTRALAALLAAVPLAPDPEHPDLQDALPAALHRIRDAEPASAGALGDELRRALHALAPESTDDTADDARPTEVVRTLAGTGAWAPHAPTAQVTRPPAPRPSPPPRSRPPSSSYGPGPVPSPPQRPPQGPPPSPHSSPARRTGVLVAAAAAVALVVLAGVVTVVLDGRDDEPAAEPPGDQVVAATIGDPRTVEPCGLVDPQALARFGPSGIVPDLGPPASCAVDVTDTGGAGDVLVSTGLATPATAISATSQRRVGPYSVRSAPARDGRCSRAIVTTENLQVVVDASARSGTALDPCAVADAATESALAALQGGPLPRRNGTDPPNALTGVDTCTLLTADDLARLPGLDPARRDAGVAGWSCRWGVGPGTTRADPVVSLGVTRRPTFTPTETIAGRPAAVLPGGGGCEVDLAGRGFTAVDGTARTELLEVTVYGGSPDDQCTRARDLAATVVPRLPPP